MPRCIVCGERETEATIHRIGVQGTAGRLCGAHVDEFRAGGDGRTCVFCDEVAVYEMNRPEPGDRGANDGERQPVRLPILCRDHLGALREGDG